MEEGGPAHIEERHSGSNRSNFTLALTIYEDAGLHVDLT
jgi:hypothetical protein